MPQMSRQAALLFVAVAQEQELWQKGRAEVEAVSEPVRQSPSACEVEYAGRRLVCPPGACLILQMGFQGSTQPGLKTSVMKTG